MIPAQQTNTTPNNVNSEAERDRMNEIQTLTQRVQELGDAAGTWTNWGQWLTGLAAVAALLYFVTSTIALKRANSLSVAQAALGEAKDRVFALQLGEANATAETARSTAAKAEEGLAKANLAIKEREQENLNLLRRLEFERSERFRYTKELTRRDVDLRNFDPSKMRPFRGMRVMMEMMDDDEPKNVALHLWHDLMFARWEFVKPILDNEPIWDGITVFFPLIPPKDDRSEEAAKTLVAELKRVGVRAGIRSSVTVPLNTVRIMIGPSDLLPNDMKILPKLNRDKLIDANFWRTGEHGPEVEARNIEKERQNELAAALEYERERVRKLDQEEMPSDARSKRVDWDRQKQLLNALPKVRVGVASVEDAEAWNLSKALSVALAGAQWPEMPPKVTDVPMRAEPGVYVLHRGDDSTAAASLADALRKSGVEGVTVLQMPVSPYMNLMIGQGIIIQGMPEVEILVSVRKLPETDKPQTGKPQDEQSVTVPPPSGNEP